MACTYSNIYNHARSVLLVVFDIKHMNLLLHWTLVANVMCFCTGKVQKLVPAKMAHTYLHSFDNVMLSAPNRLPIQPQPVTLI